MNVSARVTLSLDVVDLDILWGQHSHYGYQREDPTKPWTEAEKLKAARHVMVQIIRENIAERSAVR